MSVALRACAFVLLAAVWALLELATADLLTRCLVLWTLLGGAATVLGPVLGTALMFFLVDFASGFTTASLLFVGVALILLVLFFPKGILGTLRQRVMPWLP